MSLIAQSLSGCIKACKIAKNGVENPAIQAFCRTIPHPAIRAACWSVQFATKVGCEGFCYAFFSG